MMKLKMILATRLPLYLLLAALISMHACKNKKKAAEVTDTEAVKEQIQEELGQSDDVQINEGTKEPNTGDSRNAAVVVPKALTKSEQLSKYFREVTQSGSYEAANASKSKALSCLAIPMHPC